MNLRFPAQSLPSLASQVLDNTPLRIIDVGARGGLQDEWTPFFDVVEWVGFDADPEESERLNSIFRADSKNCQVYPYAISGKRGKCTMHFAQFPDSSGIIEPNPKFLQRLYSVTQENLRTIKTIECESTTLDDFLEKENVQPFDYLKIDVEGAEADVLEGAKESLKASNVLGVKTEVWFGPLKDATAFARMDTLLRQYGFHLFDLQSRKYPSATFPRGCFSPAGKLESTLAGQTLTGDAVYLKDPINDLAEGIIDNFQWNDTTVTKMAIIYFVHGNFDCAIELLEEYQNSHKTSMPIKEIKNALTPLLPDGKSISYEDYRNLTYKIRSQELDMFSQLWVKK